MPKVSIRQVCEYLESIAPRALQESYDNAGLLVGDPEAPVEGVLVCLDSTEAVVEEARERGCNLIVAHHPILFRGLKSLTGRTYVERTVMRALKADIAIYAIHTNLDNVLHQGVNARMAERLGLLDTRILAPKGGLLRLSVQVEGGTARALEDALREALPTHHLPSQPSFVSIGVAGAEARSRLEWTFPEVWRGAVEAVLHERGLSDWTLHALAQENPHFGSGLLGRLPEPLSETDFLALLKERMLTGCIRHTALRGKAVHTVALCGGSGSFLLPRARAAHADAFVTADFKYHEFFDAEDRILIADIGHFESEQFTMHLLQELISGKFPNFAAHLTKVNTNPVHYFP
ncbi:MAG: Nif3-like dinuclear metal center hexameric protein [Bacteroidetes bacterium]|nr:MAG: Nif3-like dinuclear metal center hexameric protein [Bacteroidota bacterium]